MLSIAWVNTLEFTAPLWFLVLPLPLLVYRLLPAYRTKQSAIRVPFFSSLLQALDEKPSSGASELRPHWWQRVILLLSWLLVVSALAKPVLLGEAQTREQLGRDVMMVLDLSGSMDERDFMSPQGQVISRLDAAKGVLNSFAEQRKGDRLGLILFGDAAFIQSPFTADLTVWQALLQQAEVAMAGQSTYLGDAVGLAIKSFENNDDADREKVVIVLTDGNDSGSFVEPLDAAKVAAAKGVRIHSIAMGDPNTVGEAALDMDVINSLASLSGGRSFQALDQQQLDEAYQQVDELEPQLFNSISYRPKQAVHFYPIALVLVMYLLAFSVMTFRQLARGNTDV
ncbi:VWA domain-containing protein [Agarivorans sp. 1_MG-2023]|uniref:VWA domain-containing protein n=1 Tax=Agarivorans sp. 1_MG-2023 TaxID=3062634 RepID=UPI0026E35346|nr:VWA domain-containing protein [Agarivorans sp. 1_MG-2023]MDO6765960.1 VWA domain-containing protein [Agarivorans sp. 1_MG-2023]